MKIDKLIKRYQDEIVLEDKALTFIINNNKHLETQFEINSIKEQLKENKIRVECYSAFIKELKELV